MSDLDVRKKGTYHSQWGPLVAWVTDYEAGRDGGDHRVAGFTNTAAQAAGQGPTFDRWTIIGHDEGEFSVG